ncbi:MAG: 5'/3'-nucleotidase SurE [Anaerolineales bacterium]|jgi:5'-nucleotidase
MTEKKQILLTNDDGIRSPGLWSAARALSELGFVTVAAPEAQSSGAGRSMPPGSPGVIREEWAQVGERRWKVYAIGGTPAQAVELALLELLEDAPDLVVAGINYGENVGSGVTVSGTIGAALEGAAHGIPALAISLQTESRYNLTYSEEIDFDAAAYFSAYFADKMLTGLSWPDLDLLKVEVPAGATPKTPWKLARLSRTRYYVPQRPERQRLDLPTQLGYSTVLDPNIETDSDVYVLRVERKVAVTPLSLDLTSRLDLQRLEQVMRKESQKKTLSPDGKITAG